MRLLRIALVVVGLLALTQSSHFDIPAVIGCGLLIFALGRS